MCDERTANDEANYLQQQRLNRRDFSKAGIATAVSMMLPTTANAVDVIASDVQVPTPDGDADCYFVRPASGAHAGVIIWPDIKGIRPAFRQMGKRLAESGYSVLVVNPYYRTVQGEVIVAGESFRDPAVRERLMPHARSLSPTTCVTDGRAFVEYLDAQDVVDSKRKIGTSGYCMTGSYTIRLLAALPERIGAGASFHGGGLVTDQPDSPHLLAGDIEGGVLVAIAENDHEKEPFAEGQLREAFADADVRAEIEVYKDTLHGWCPPDSDVYHEEQAERAWGRMLALFEQELA